MHALLQGTAWMVALAWSVRTAAAHRGLPRIADLRDAEHSRFPDQSLTVIVPARNEEAGIRACLESLLMQELPGLRVIAVDDRSTDATGHIIDELSVRHPDRLRALHLRDLPPGWLGKTHAMAAAAALAETEFLLFTDGDILFAPAALRRALGYAVAERADHLVVIPTTVIRRWDEAALLSFFQIFGLWAIRPWRVADPKSRDAIGIGAFNLVRRSAYERIGGFDALRMQIVEDLALGRSIKAGCMRQRVASGPGLVSVYWAAGVPGLINVMTKNVFAAVNYHAVLVMGGCLWLLFFCVLPFVGIWMREFTAPCLVVVVSIGWQYLLFARLSGLSAWNFLAAPFAAAVFAYTLVRSMMTTLLQGGVLWRGTFYSLPELRRHALPLRRRGTP